MIGTTLRQYVIKSPLGKGGMGEVWLARDTTLDRDVALKILPLDSSDDTATRKERFFREAKAASALNHPNIVTIHEINHDQGFDFIAMEYVDGRTLASLLRPDMPIAEIERYATQIAAAVGRAHRANIVHRDLKPGNIMVTLDGLVKVLDFGLAKALQTQADAAAETVEATPMRELTREGTTLGTLGYMSPEQSVGDYVDARSDVFAFGVICYEMLAGQRPFGGKTRSENLRQLHLSKPLPLEQLRPDTPARLREIVMRCLQKKPDDRFPSLREVHAALAGGTAADVVSETSAAAAVPRRHMPIAVRVALGIAALVIAGVLLARPGWLRPGAGGSTPADSAAPGDLTREAGALLARPDRAQNADTAIALLERAVGADPSSAIAYAHLSTAYLRKHTTNPDAQWMKLARETAQRAVDLNGDLGASRLAIGFVQLQAGERANADASFRKAAELDPMNPMPHVGLAMNFAADRKNSDAEAAFRKAVELGPKEWRAPAEYAQFEFRRAHYQEAEALWESALQITPDNALVMRNLGAVYFVLDRPDEAASILQRALEVAPTAPIYTNLGTIRFFQGRYTDAVAAFEKAVEQAANNHLYWGNLGDGLRWAPGRRKDAPAAYRRAVELINEQIVKKQDDPDLQSRRALYLIKIGDKEPALEEATSVASRPNLTAQMHYRLAVIYELGGERAHALASLQQALTAGYAVKDLASEPEFTSMRADARYHRLLDSVGQAKR
jgi:eukaryotic-like serine/threonine-protein kinase